MTGKNPTKVMGYPYCKELSKILEGVPLNFRLSSANITIESEN
ncbi:MAG: hypothetical protein WBP64_19565 [Nitrososphaeraceae archaeon]